MGFRNDFSQAQQNSNLKPEGDYEVIIVKIEERATPNGKLGLNLSMVIRNDVEQSYKNGYIFHTLWKRREPTPADMQVNGYGFGQIMALGKAVSLPDGKDYADLGEFLGDVAKRPLRVHLTHETYQNVKRERVSYMEPTHFPEVRHVMKAAPTAAGAYAEPRHTQFAAAPNNAAQAYQAAGNFAQVAGSFAQLPLDGDLPF